MNDELRIRKGKYTFFCITAFLAAAILIPAAFFGGIMCIAAIL